MDSDQRDHAERDPAMAALLHPFAIGRLRFPAGERVLFLRARLATGLPEDASAWMHEQTFRPAAERLQRAGYQVGDASGRSGFELALLLLPRQRDEARALLARALEAVVEGGVVVASVANNEGARSAERDLSSLAGATETLSKSKCRVFWARKSSAAMDGLLATQWLAFDTPRLIGDGRFLSRPGLFAWDRIDVASALLAGCLPADLRGEGADLGAGFGYLATEVLDRCPGVTALDLFEAEARALALACENLAALAPSRNPPVRLGFHWHDVTQGLPGRYDFVVSNPPFHQGRADEPDLGRAFIAAAGAALRPSGRLWLVANRHLAYETELQRNFASVRRITDDAGFKVIEAVKAGK